MTRLATALSAVAMAAICGGAAADPAGLGGGLFAGRSPGSAEACIDRLDIESVAVVPGAFAYTMKTGGVVWLNRPAAGAGFVHRGVVPFVDAAYPRLCRGEQVKLLNENSRAPIASVTLGDFIPYRRP